jgi:hypothetical protein
MSRNKMMVPLLVYFGAVVCVVAAQGAPPEDRGKDSAKARLEVARKGLALVEKQGPARGPGSPDVYIWSKHVLNAELDLSGNEDERLAAQEAHLKRTIRLEDMAKNWFDRGLITEVELLEATYHRLDAEVQLAKSRAAASSPRK